MLQSYLFYFYWNHHTWIHDTKITFLLQLQQMLGHIYWKKRVKLAAILDFFIFFCPFTHIMMVCHAVYCAYLIAWPRKYRFRPQNHDPTWSNFRDIWNIRSWGGHFEKWPKLVVSPISFSGNIAYMIPKGPLNKMVPLTEDHGGGGTSVSSRTKIQYFNVPLRFSWTAVMDATKCGQGSTNIGIAIKIMHRICINLLIFKRWVQ